MSKESAVRALLEDTNVCVFQVNDPRANPQSLTEMIEFFYVPSDVNGPRVCEVVPGIYALGERGTNASLLGDSVLRVVGENQVWTNGASGFVRSYLDSAFLNYMSTVISMPLRDLIAPGIPDEYKTGEEVEVDPYDFAENMGSGKIRKVEFV